MDKQQKRGSLLAVEREMVVSEISENHREPSQEGRRLGERHGESKGDWVLCQSFHPVAMEADVR